MIYSLNHAVRNNKEGCNIKVETLYNTMMGNGLWKTVVLLPSLLGLSATPVNSLFFVVVFAKSSFLFNRTASSRGHDFLLLVFAFTFGLTSVIVFGFGA